SEVRHLAPQACRPGSTPLWCVRCDPVIVAYLLLAAPITAVVLFWGSWGWVGAAAIVAVVEYRSLQRSQRFSARVWRSIGVGRRRQRERGAESIYVVSAVVGVSLLVASLLGLG